MNARSGIDVHGIVETAEELQKGTGEDEQKQTLRKIVIQAKR